MRLSRRLGASLLEKKILRSEPASRRIGARLLRFRLGQIRIRWTEERRQ